MKHKRIYLSILVLIFAWYGVAFMHVANLDSQRPIDPDTSYHFPVLSKDSTEYAKLSENILRYHVFSLSSKAPFAPETFRTPGYPIFIASILALTHSYGLVSLVQIILTFITGFLLYLIARKVLPDELAFSMMVVYLLEFTVLMQSLLILSDGLFVFLLVLSIFLILRGVGNWKYLIISGLACGLSVMVRPFAMLFPLLLGGYLLVAYDGKWKRRLTLTAVFFVGIAIIMVPWMVRNKVETGILGVSSIGPYNFFYANLIPYLATRDHLTEDVIMSSMQDQLEPIKDPRSLVYSSALTQLVIQYISRDPFGYARYHITKTLPLFFSSSLKEFTKIWSGNIHVLSGRPGLAGLLASGNIRAFMSAIMSQGWYVLENIFWLFMFLIGIASLWDHRNRRLVLLCYLCILYFTIATGPVSYARYRLSLEPFLFILAAMGGFYLWNKRYTLIIHG